MSDSKHKKIKIEHLTNTNSTANEFVEEFGGKEDLFVNTIRNNQIAAAKKVEDNGTTTLTIGLKNPELKSKINDNFNRLKVSFRKYKGIPNFQPRYALNPKQSFKTKVIKFFKALYYANFKKH